MREFLEELADLLEVHDAYLQSDAEFIEVVVPDEYGSDLVEMPFIDRMLIRKELNK